MPEPLIAVIKGGGDLATGVAYRLAGAGFRLVVTEIAQPTTVRRAVALSQAIYDGEVEVQGLRARRVASSDQVPLAWDAGAIPVLVDPTGQVVRALPAAVVVDATMAKRNLGTCRDDAPVVIALGPGFVAGVDAHAVIETQRGPHLGQVIWAGAAAADTGVPGEVAGYTCQRVLRSPGEGRLRGARAIGDQVEAGEIVGWVDAMPVRSSISGVLRGLASDGLLVRRHLKIGDVDPRSRRELCFSISDKALAVGDGVLAAVRQLTQEAP